MLNRKTSLLSIGRALTFTLAFVSKVAEGVLLGATMPKQAMASSKPPVTNLAQLIRSLRSRGHKVARKERVEQPFLSVKGQIIKIDDQDVQVFEYRTAHAAELDGNDRLLNTHLYFLYYYGFGVTHLKPVAPSSGAVISLSFGHSIETRHGPTHRICMM